MLSMWRLSWITFIFLPLTFIVGFFGMNVDVFAKDPSIKWHLINYWSSPGMPYFNNGLTEGPPSGTAEGNLQPNGTGAEYNVGSIPSLATAGEDDNPGPYTRLKRRLMFQWSAQIASRLA